MNTERLFQSFLTGHASRLEGPLDTGAKWARPAGGAREHDEHSTNQKDPVAPLTTAVHRCTTYIISSRSRMEPHALALSCSSEFALLICCSALCRRRRCRYSMRRSLSVTVWRHLRLINASRSA
jgi:hypothetical protein